MSFSKPEGHSLRDLEVAEFVKLPQPVPPLPPYTFATLPARPSTINSPNVLGCLAFTSDQGMCLWNGTIWIVIGSGGGGTSAGPTNTPGFGSAILTPAQDTTTRPNWSPTNLNWATGANQTSNIRFTPAANSGNGTTYSGLAATDSQASPNTAGNQLTALLTNLSTTDVGQFTNEDAGSAATNRFLTPGATTVIIPPQGQAFVTRDNTSGRWRFA